VRDVRRLGEELADLAPRHSPNSYDSRKLAGSCSTVGWRRLPRPLDDPRLHDETRLGLVWSIGKTVSMARRRGSQPRRITSAAFDIATEYGLGPGARRCDHGCLRIQLECVVLT